MGKGQPPGRGRSPKGERVRAPRASLALPPSVRPALRISHIRICAIVQGTPPAHCFLRLSADCPLPTGPGERTYMRCCLFMVACGSPHPPVCRLADGHLLPVGEGIWPNGGHGTASSLSTCPADAERIQSTWATRPERRGSSPPSPGPPAGFPAPSALKGRPHGHTINYSRITRTDNAAWAVSYHSLVQCRTPCPICR